MWHTAPRGRRHFKSFDMMPATSFRSLSFRCLSLSCPALSPWASFCISLTYDRGGMLCYAVCMSPSFMLVAEIEVLKRDIFYAIRGRVICYVFGGLFRQVFYVTFVSIKDFYFCEHKYVSETRLVASEVWSIIRLIAKRVEG